VLAFGACASPEPTTAEAPVPATTNPAAPGFDVTGSDPEAIEIADRTMKAMGGRAAWDATRYVSWNFFGFRSHVWDRHRGLDRVEWADRDSGEKHVVVVDVDEGTGRAWVDGEEITEPARLAELTEAGRRAWINDAYWLVMPYKLKDTGVTLTYAGRAPMADGREADVLELTFSNVGVTPENKYRVYVAKDSGLVEQWDFFASAADDEPRFSTPWHGWTEHGNILLSGDRGERNIEAIAVHDDVPASVFEDPAPTGLDATGAEGGGG
jgi:hypothetical protein